MRPVWRRCHNQLRGVFPGIPSAPVLPKCHCLIVCAEGKTTAGKPKKVNVCPHCHMRGYDEEISSDGKNLAPSRARELHLRKRLQTSTE